MRGYYDSQQYGFSKNPYWTPGVKFLILTNIAVFALQILFLLMPSSWGLGNFLANYFALWPNKVVEHFYIWQLLTSAFLHDITTIWHLIFNLLTLYFLGFMVERHYGTRQFLSFYFTCALFAALIYTSVHFVIQTRTSYALGASGAIMGVLMLAACLYPHNIVFFEFFFPIKLRTIVWIVIAINVYMALPIHSNVSDVAVSAHLGGLLFGYLYYRFGMRLRQYYEKLGNHLVEEYHRERQKKHEDLREEVDKLLDKIHREGLNALTSKEREFLRRASKEYQRDTKA